MFNSKRDRLNYGRLMMPPEGFKLVAAAGTTYSLDLAALTAVVNAVALSENTDSAVSNNPILVLKAIQKVSDKIVVFSDGDGIKPFTTGSPLGLLLEKTLVTVAIGKPKSSNQPYPSFHPKTWTLLYEDRDGKKFVRFIVLSRNLTFDRSWDVAICLEGEGSSHPDERQQPLISFLDFLKNRISSEYEDSGRKKKIIGTLIKGLKGVRLELGEGLGHSFDDFRIMPMGIGKGAASFRKEPMMSSDSFFEMLVVSPFVSKEFFEGLKGKNPLKNATKTLITRSDALVDDVWDSLDGFSVYCLKDQVVDGEEILSDGTDEYPMRQDVHAKLLFHNRYGKTQMYLGSMNATNSGLDRNVEIMIKLTGTGRVNARTILSEIVGQEDDESPFKKVTERLSPKENPSEDERKKLIRTVKSVCRLDMKGTVIPTADNAYSIEIKVRGEGLPGNVLISPAYQTCPKWLQDSVRFDGITLLHLSELYEVEVRGVTQTLKRIIMIPTSPIPPSRDSVVIRNILKDSRGFVEYVSCLLDDNNLASMISDHGQITEPAGKKDSWNALMPGLYEKMLRVCCSDPSKLSDISVLINELKGVDDIVPDEFISLFELFKKSLRIK